MNFQGKITALEHTEGTNRYGEPYSGSRITVVEQNPEPGHYRNAATLYVPDGQGQTQLQVGDIGTVDCYIDLKNGDNGPYNKVTCRNFVLVTPATF